MLLLVSNTKRKLLLWLVDSHNALIRDVFEITIWLAKRGAQAAGAGDMLMERRIFDRRLQVGNFNTTEQQMHNEKFHTMSSKRSQKFSY